MYMYHFVICLCLCWLIFRAHLGAKLWLTFEHAYKTRRATLNWGVRCSRKLQAICPNLIVYLLLFQVNLALSVIYSRHLLAILLGNWCDCGMITSELIDNSDEVQLIGLLDILQKLESKELFEKVSFTLVACHRSKSRAMWVVGGGIGGFNHLFVSITNADSVAHELWELCRSLIM